MYSSHNNWVLKVSRLALVLLYFPLWLVHCAFKHFITIFNWVLKVSRIALVLLWFCFGFALFSSVIGPKKFAPLSQTIRYKTTINLDLVCCIFLVFWAVLLFLLWGLFWLNVMITFMTLSLQTLLSKNHFLISNFSIRKVVRKFKVLLKLAATWRIIYLCVLLPSATTCLVNDLERMVVHKSHAFHS